MLLRTVSEEQWQAQVLRWAQRFGWWAYHTRDSRKSVSGFPDLVLVRPPRIIFAELKAWKRQISRSQDGWLELLRKLDLAEVYVWRPQDEAAVERALR